MPFSNQVIITLKPLENFSCPPEEFRDKMTGELKVFFGRKLAPDIWADLCKSYHYAIGREGNFSTLHLPGVNLANEMSLIDPDLMAQSLNKITSVTLFDSSVSVNQVWQSL